jgi:23S rRNA pseudouridine1911/1915/1917 synthase
VNASFAQNAQDTQIMLYADGADKDMRLDVFLTDEIEGQSRSSLQRIISTGLVLVNSKPERSSYRLRVGDIITVNLPEPTALNVEPEDIPLDVIYEDEFLIVINKPQGMVVHPAAGHQNGTLVNALLYHCDNLSGINGVIRPGIVHRLDRDTSGAILVAKNDEAHTSLSRQLAAHEVLRKYHALVKNTVKADTGVINQPIGRHMTDRKRMTVTHRGKPAVTHYTVLGRHGQGNDAYTHIEARLETGRTHQIRVHMTHMGHPLLGDPVYGKGADKRFPGGQALHAKALGFTHPHTSKYMQFEAELPEYFLKYIE